MFPWDKWVSPPNGISIGSAVFWLPMHFNGADNPPNCLFPYSSNTSIPGPIRVSIPDGISISSPVYAQLTIVSLYFTMGRHFSSKAAPSPWGLGPPWSIIRGSLGPPKSAPQTHLSRFSRFCRARNVPKRPRPRNSLRSNSVLSIANPVMRPKISQHFGKLYMGNSTLAQFWFTVAIGLFFAPCCTRLFVEEAIILLQTEAHTD